MHKNRITIVILLICLLLCVVGCQYNNTSQEIHPKDRNILYGDSETPLDINTESDACDDSYEIDLVDDDSSEKELIETEEIFTELTTDITEEFTITEYVDEDTEKVTEEYTVTSYDISSIPDFRGEPYYILNNNVPFFDDSEKANIEAFEYYSDLDELGRCGVAYANICIDLMPTEERGEIGQIRPSGWHTVKYNEIIDGNYLYNRCHLIGYQLAGENANEKNLITGTRYMNIVGMLAFESEVYEYVQETNNHVLYRVTPIFERDNLVASGVEMEAFSVEDGGTGVCFHVYIYNVQPGIIIDYATGDSEIDTGYVSTYSTENIELNDDELSDYSSVLETPDCDYVLNKNTRKFHFPSCGSVQDMKDKNKEYYTGDRQTLIDQGYSPCGRCKP